MAKGKLRVYLGAAPGVGKTYAMLSEGKRRLDRGTHVVVGYVETHGRKLTMERLEGLPLIPRRSINYRGMEFSEMDLPTILKLKPQVVLVDELAHTNVPGLENEKRWQDIHDLLDAGINVISTVNIQHLESLVDVVENITGVRQRETVPDDVVRDAEQIELIDMTPQALRKRMTHGNIYIAEKIDSALSNYFREGNLTALRELALLWLADRVEEKLIQYRTDHKIDTIWQTRDRTVVGVTSSANSAILLRRGARIASKGAGGELHALYVVQDDGLAEASPAVLASWRQLTDELGGQFHTVLGTDIADTMLEFARGINATRIVIGASRKKKFRNFFHNSLSDKVLAESGDIDVHIVTPDSADKHKKSFRFLIEQRRSSFHLSRISLLTWLCALLGPILLTIILEHTRSYHSLATELSLYLAITVVCSLSGKILPSIVSVFIGSVLLNFYFTSPGHSIHIQSFDNGFAMLIGTIIAIAISIVISSAATRSKYANTARQEAAVLGHLANTLLMADQELPALLDEMINTFGLYSVSLLKKNSDGDWEVIERSGELGEHSSNVPADATATFPLNDRYTIIVDSQPLSADSRRLLTAFAAHAAIRVERRSLAGVTNQITQLSQADQIHKTLIADTARNIREPLTAIKSAVRSLQSDSVSFSDDDYHKLISSISKNTALLEIMLDNLFDINRIKTDQVLPLFQEVGLHEILPVVIASLPNITQIQFDIASDILPLWTDPELLTKIIITILETVVLSLSNESTLIFSAINSEKPLTNTQIAHQEAKVTIAICGKNIPAANTVNASIPLSLEDHVKQLHNPDFSHNEYGLGLAVASSFTHLLAGKLITENSTDGEIIYILEFPAVQTN